MTPAGVVLAGGQGRRMAPASKPAVEVAGRPLVHWPLAALASCCAPLAVVCKPGTALPALPAGVERWEEPAERFHPAEGLVAALERAGGEVLVCAADMPLVDEDALRALLAGPAEADAVVARAGGRLQPLLALYRLGALGALRATAEAEASLTGAVETLGAALVDVGERVALSVDSPAAVVEAELLLSA